MAFRLPAQTPGVTADPELAGSPERWNLFWQATSIGQHHGSFRSLYEGTNSLASHPESRASLTTTLFLGWWRRIQRRYRCGECS
jgi:hypothetical protein